MKVGSIILFSVALVSGKAWAQPPADMEEPQVIHEAAQNSATGFGIGFLLGVGDYPILSMPMMESSAGRVDGSQLLDDVRSNRGSLLGLNLNWRSDQDVYPVTVTGNWLRVATAPGTGIPTPASYSRLSLNLASSLRTGIQSLTVEPGVEARRSMYLNVDSGHYIDSIHLMTKLVSKPKKDLAISLYYSFAPWSKFGLLQGSNTEGSGVLPGSRARVEDLGSSLTWSTRGQTDVVVAFVNERSSVSLDDTGGYTAYGLPVTSDPKLSGPKKFQLNVRQVLIGTQKRF